MTSTLRPQTQQPSQSRTALVTGAGKGIGAAIARRLAADGFAVIVNYARDTASAARVVDAIADAGGRARAVQGDVADPETMPALFDTAEAAFGSVSVLVNNAGILRTAPLTEATEEDFAAQSRINSASALFGMQMAARRMPDGGRIINLSSSVVRLSLPGYGLYAASKAAVEAMTPILAKELGSRRITVNAIAPGPIATDLFLDGKSEELIAGITRMIPLGRLGLPEDIAAVASFLAGPDGGWINGQVLRANGGMA